MTSVEFSLRFIRIVPMPGKRIQRMQPIGAFATALIKGIQCPKDFAIICPTLHRAIESAIGPSNNGYGQRTRQGPDTQVAAGRKIQPLPSRALQRNVPRAVSQNYLVCSSFTCFKPTPNFKGGPLQWGRNCCCKVFAVGTSPFLAKDYGQAIFEIADWLTLPRCVS